MRLSCCSLLAACILAACGDESAPPPSLPRALATTDSLQGLTGPQRDSLHHLSEGDEFIPVAWLLALDNPATGKRFLDDVERFGMLPDPADEYGLPIGLSHIKPSDVGEMAGEMVGFTCAACHTGHLTYRGKEVLIEGGSGTVDAEGFERELVAAMDDLKKPLKFAAWVRRVRAIRAAGDTGLQANLPDFASLKALYPEVRARMRSFEAVRDLLAHADRTPSGYGRIDAFGTGRNLLYPDSKVPLTAPVRYPVVYDAYRHKWLHWDANTNSVFERNIGQAIAAGAIVDPKTKRSSLRPLNLYLLEQLTGRVVPPKWPAEVFGAIDTALAAQGRPLYAQLCEGCHALRAVGPAPGDAPGDGQGETRVWERDTLIPWKDVGTDPQRATSAAIPLKRGGKYPVVAGELLRVIKDSAFRQNRISPDSQAKLEGKRAQSKWRVTQAYAARPLTAIWSHPPYLHNGSVPTLHDLLLPPSQRPDTFELGHHEFDPAKVGLAATGPRRGPPFLFDTRLTGNSNAGHIWGTMLGETERKQLLEFLKTL